MDDDLYDVFIVYYVRARGMFSFLCEYFIIEYYILVGLAMVGRITVAIEIQLRRSFLLHQNVYL